MLLGAGLLAVPVPARTTQAAGAAPDVVLVTLDTTRRDALGAYGGAAATPILDRLAAAGTRFETAVSPAPLTAPAHASLLTGLLPPEHGVRDNGAAVLPADRPTLATELAAHGYRTGAVVASSVLDRRFGFDRGFADYDDRIAAESMGEYGYPERSAEQVTEAALAWVDASPRRPFFLWVHYYDPHAPYLPPGLPAEAGIEERYRGEVERVDRALGRLLRGLPGSPAERLVGVVGDHGEMLGEHGERTHGVLLYRGSLEVPLILVGPGVPAGRIASAPVATRRLAATLLRLAVPSAGTPLGAPLSWAADGAAPAVYSETWLPATAYGWSPLRSVTEGRWRWVEAPRPELYDLEADPGETVNLVRDRPEVAGRLRQSLAALAASWSERAGEVLDLSGTGATLRALGYLSGQSGEVSAQTERGSLDPKDGILMLGELEEAKRLLAAGRARAARVRLERLVRSSPGNVPFLLRAAQAQLATGAGDRALATLARAAALNPGLDLIRLQRAEALVSLGRLAEARAAFTGALDLNPRLAGAWLGLARLAREAGDPADEREILDAALAAGTVSATILTRLGRIAREAGEAERADELLRRAAGLLPPS